MTPLPANTGWLWIKQGLHYFKQQPMEFSMLFLSYFFSMLILGIIPYLGQLLAFILLPLFTLSFMQACKEVDQGARVRPRLLFFGFYAPHAARLFQLGLLYLIAAIAALGASVLIDGGVFWQVITGQMELTAQNIEGSGMTLAMLFAMLCYIPALMAFWFAGPLIAWQQMPVFKAIFYSFFASLRATRAFLVYGLIWFVLGGILPTIVGILIAALTGNPNMIVIIMMPLSMMLTIILYCSFYPTYRSIFPPVAIEE